MAERSYFFNSSVEQPKTYPAESFSDIFDAFAGASGYFAGYKGELLVTANGTDLFINVSSGAAIVDGCVYINDASKQLEVEYSSTPRYDRVVVQLNTGAKTIETKIKKGTAAEPPELQQDNTIWEISLCVIGYDGGSFVNELIDERGTGLCERLETFNNGFNSRLFTLETFKSQTISGVQKVGLADNSEKLGGKTPTELLAGTTQRELLRNSSSSVSAGNTITLSGNLADYDEIIIYVGINSSDPGQGFPIKFVGTSVADNKVTLSAVSDPMSTSWVDMYTMYFHQLSGTSLKIDAIHHASFNQNGTLSNNTASMQLRQIVGIKY